MNQQEALERWNTAMKLYRKNLRVKFRKERNESLRVKPKV